MAGKTSKPSTQPPGEALSPKHEAFVQAYITNGMNAVKAYQAAYPRSSEKAARSNATRLMENDGIQARIAEIMAVGAERAEVTAEEVIRELKKLGFSCIGKAVTWRNEVVTQELEDRTAVTLLSKPIRRSDFLLGKFLGLWLSVIPGVLVLAGILVLTLWMMALPHLHLYDSDVAKGLKEGVSPFVTAWRAIWKQFVLTQGGIVVQGALLSIFQSAILAALAVSFSAFFPNVVAVAATTLAFILANISSYMVASVERMNAAPLTFAARGLKYLMPNMGYFNLQMRFNEGRITSFAYLALSFAYAALFVSAVFLVSCSLFRKREVR